MSLAERQGVQIVKPQSSLAGSVIELNAMIAGMSVLPAIRLLVVIILTIVALVLIRRVLPVVKSVRPVDLIIVMITSGSVLRMNIYTVRHIPERVLNVMICSARHTHVLVHIARRGFVRQTRLTVLPVGTPVATKM